MHYNGRLLAAMIGGAALISLGALSVGVGGVPAIPASATGAQMTLGATTTETTPLAVPAVGKAAPAIKGPAK